MTSTTDSERRRAIAWLVLLCIPMFFVGLGSYDLDLKGEPREGLTAWAAIHQDFLLPVLNGERLPEKPVFFPWLVAAAMKVFGETSEWALRLPSALMGTALVLVVFGLGRRLISVRGGLLAAAATSCTFLVIKLAHSARVDMTLSFFVCSALLLFLVEFQRTEAEPDSRPSLGRVLAFWFCLAFGTLTKGPLAVILVGLAILPFLLVRKRLGFVFRMRPLLGLAVLVAIPGAWYAHGLQSQGREFGFRAFLMENVLMFLGAEGGGGHRHGPFYFIPDYFFFGLPWSVLLPAAVVWAVRRGRGRFRSEPMTLPLGWFAAMFVFFSIASGKRQDYLLPLLPAAALLVAGAIDAATAGSDDRTRRWLARSSWALAAAGLCGVALVAVALWAPSFLPGEIAQRKGTWQAVEVVARHPVASVTVLSAIVVAVLAVPIGFARRWADAGVLLTAGAVSAAVAVAAVLLQPDIVATETYKPFAAEIQAKAGPEGVVCRYGDFEPQIFFYMNRVVPPIASGVELDAFLTQPSEAWLISNGERWRRLPARRKSRLELVDSVRHPGQTDDDASVLLRRIPADH